MNNEVMTMLATAAINACVTYGVVKTQLAWLRRDVDSILELRDGLLKAALRFRETE